MKNYLSPQAAAILFRQLAVAQRKQLPFADLLDILVQDAETFGDDQAWLQLLAQEMRRGTSLTAALLQMPELISKETAALLQTAEQQGKLADTLDAIAQDYAQRGAARATLLSAIIFPSFMLIVLSIIFMIMMIFVLPQFKSLFSGFGAELPPLTLFLIRISDVFSSYWWLLLLIGIVLAVAWYFERLPRGLLLGVEQLLLRVPFVRRYLVQRFISRLVQWLKLSQDTLFIQTCLHHVAATERMLSLQDCIHDLQKRLAQGKPLAEALQQLPPLPARLSLFMQLGEKMEDHAAAFAQLAEMSERDTDLAFARFERGLTLSLYVTLGILVGVVVIAIYLPIFKMGAVL